MMPFLTAAVLGLMPMTALAFTPPATAHQARFIRALHSSINEDDFDPFLQSPLSFGSSTDDNSNNNSPTESTFGFDLGVMNKPESLLSDDSAATATAVSTTPDNGDLEFDPLLSPHAYANGVDAAPVGAVQVVDNAATASSPLIATGKLGILLIDHGSRRQASNDHIHSVATMYENRLNVKKNNDFSGDTTIVRAAHMEICEPSIIASMRDLVTNDEVTKIVCVPFFLSPGRHATEDVPQLIEEAKEEFAKEGVVVDIVMSNALGTQLESMMGAVDELVELTLNGGT